jgi:pilus assembly protein CpaF
VIDALLNLGDVKVTPTQTTGHIRLPDGTRILAVVPPTAISGPYLVIRKMPGQRLDIDKLLSFQFINEDVVSTLKNAIEARVNILVSGGTGSGKTTFSNILTDVFPTSERIIVVERLFEMQFWHPRVVRLAADGSPDLTFEDLIETASRMRPDRLVFGEIKGPEAYRMLEVINLGHDGSLMSIHATSVNDALNRLETFCLMANLGLGIPQIRNQIASALGLITYQQKQQVGNRRLIEIAELLGVENDRYVLQPLYHYNPEIDLIESTGVKPSWEKAWTSTAPPIAPRSPPIPIQPPTIRPTFRA